MVESQSRYKIMEELNNRKIKEKEKLANIERETDNKEYELEAAINIIKQSIKDKESTYEQDHRDKKRSMEVSLKLLESDFDRQKQKLDDAIKDEEDNYKQRFQDWKSDTETTVKDSTDELARYSKIQKQKIAEKGSIIKEIEAGIASLKEMSKEQSKEAV